MNATRALNSLSSIPVLFLDIDGVSNSMPSPKLHQLERYGPYESTTVLDQPISYSPAVIEFLNELNRSGQVEIIWCTTWCEQARSAYAPAVGFDDFPAIATMEGGEFSWNLDWWKWRAVRDFLGDNEENRRVIWIDDDLNFRVKDAFSYRYDYDGSRSHLVTPSTQPGLTPANMAGIRAFLEVS